MAVVKSGEVLRYMVDWLKLARLSSLLAVGLATAECREQQAVNGHIFSTDAYLFFSAGRTMAVDPQVW